ncbi:MAG: N-formylglutamate amidohydrolase [Marinosulfonomonas sp.]
MTISPLSLTMPRHRTTSVVFASPHSGRNYPRSFLSRSILDEHTIRSSEDAFVDVLFSAVPQFGAPLLTATAPRAFVDLNRSSDELDPALVQGVQARSINPRVSSGLGVVPRVVSNGRAIYNGKLTMAEVAERLRLVWEPYHAQLHLLLSENIRNFQEAILVDCHSMPHEAIESIGQKDGLRPDVVLGDRFGAAADADLVERIESAFVSAGLRVVRNSPFAGAYMAQNYGRPSRGQHVVQIEIDRSLYMNEETIKPNENFEEVRSILTHIAAEIAAIGRKKQSLAAE